MVSLPADHGWIQWNQYSKLIFSKTLLVDGLPCHILLTTRIQYIYPNSVTLFNGPNNIFFSSLSFRIFAQIDVIYLNWMLDFFRCSIARMDVSAQAPASEETTPRASSSSSRKAPIPPHKFSLHRFSQAKAAIFETLSQDEEFHNATTFRTQYHIANRMCRQYYLDRRWYWVHSITFNEMAQFLNVHTASIKKLRLLLEQHEPGA
jgi:hypothetical protein